MTIPASIPTRDVHINIVTESGGGTLEFPCPALYDTSGQLILAATVFEATLSDSEATIELPRCDVDTITPLDWAYRVRLKVAGMPHVLTLQVIDGVGAQEFASTVQPGGTPNPATIYATAANLATEATARAAGDAYTVVAVGDDIQDAIDAVADAGGGVVWLRPGTHTHTGLTMRSGVILDGGSAEAVDLVLAAGSDVDCIITADFGTLTGTGASGLSNSGPHGWAIRNVTIVGSQDDQSGTSWGLRAYGYDWTLDGVHIRDCLSGGLYSEWGDFGLSEVDAPGMEAHVYRSKIHHNGGPGWHHRGPHDSHAVDVVIWENVGYGLWAESDDGVYSANGTTLTGVHCYGSAHTWAMVWDSQVHAADCQVEGAATGQLWVRYGDCTWSGGAVYDIAVGGGAGLGIRLGDTAGSVLTTGARIDTILTGWKGSSAATAAIDLQSTAQCEVLARVWLTTATGTAINGTPDSTDTMLVAVGGAGMSAATAAARSAVILQGSYLQRLPAAAANAWLLQAAGGADVLNINTSAGRVELLGGRQVWLYSDPYYGSPAIKLDGAAGHIAVVSTTVPSAVPGGALGTGAPAIQVDAVSNDQRGLLGFGTGSNAFPGNAIAVTFAAAFPTTPQVVLQARNGATAALRPFPSSISASGFSVELESDPADGQTAGTYYVSYVVMG